MNKQLFAFLGLLCASAALLLYPSPCDAKTFNVSPGMSIQEAIDKAEPGDTIQVFVGDYHESVLIDKENISLIGMPYEGGRPTLNGTDVAEGLGHGIEIMADGATVQGFTIEKYQVTGIAAQNVKRITLKDIIVRHVDVVGLSADHVDGLTMERVVSSDNRSVGILILNCQDISISNSEAALSIYGFVLFESLQCTVENSSFYGNSVGVYIASSPDPRAQYGDFATFRFCRIVGNVGDSTRKISDTIELPAYVSAGIGIAIVGADHTTVEDSILSGNASCAIATFANPNAEPAADNQAEESRRGIPDHTYVHRNAYSNNGRAPSDDFKKTFEGVDGCDLYWDGTGIRNQWQENTELKTHPENLVTEQGGVHTDVIHFL